MLEKIAFKLSPVALLLLRVVFGWQIYVSGRGKFFNTGMEGVAGYFEKLGIPLPELNAYVASSAELVGGSLLMLGLFTRFASVPLMITMVVAFVTAHTGDVKSIDDFFSQDVVALFAAFLVVFVYGPGPVSLDHLLFKRSSN